MKTDPSKACTNEEQRTFWAFIHDAISHPLMAFTGWCQLSLDFHDWTSHKAWPRLMPVMVGSEFSNGMLLYTFSHPNVDHDFVTFAANYESAQQQANKWFITLEAEFGGEFTL